MIWIANFYSDIYFSNYPFPKAEQYIYFFYSQNNNACSFIPFCSASGRPTSNARTQSYGAEGNIGHDNPLYGQTFRLPNDEPEYLEIGQLQQPSVGFPSPHYDPRDHY